MSYVVLKKEMMITSSPLYDYSVNSSISISTSSSSTGNGNITNISNGNGNNNHHGSPAVGQLTPNSEMSSSTEYQSPSPSQFAVDQAMTDHVASKMTLSTRSLSRMQHRAMNDSIIQW